MKITVIGTAYVGLVSGTCLAESGNQVIFITVWYNLLRSSSSWVMPVKGLLLER